VQDLMQKTLDNYGADAGVIENRTHAGTSVEEAGVVLFALMYKP
jgi:hypothetical protein